LVLQNKGLYRFLPRFFSLHSVRDSLKWVTRPR
jgi:hypothetical protein